MKENPKLNQKKTVELALNSVTVNSRIVIPLPARIQNTLVTADYQDGILNLTLPKSESEKNKVVKVRDVQKNIIPAHKDLRKKIAKLSN